MGLLVLCFTCETSLFGGDGQGGSRLIPHISYAMNLPVKRRIKKGLYTSQSSAVVCDSRTSFDTVASINVCFLYFFWTSISQFLA